MKHHAHQHNMNLGSEDFTLIIEDTQDVRALLEQKRQQARHAEAQRQAQAELFAQIRDNDIAQHDPEHVHFTAMADTVGRINARIWREQNPC